MEHERPLGDGERLDWLRLIRSENVGPMTFHGLMGHFGKAGEAIAALPELARRGGRRGAIEVYPRAAAEKEMGALEKLGGRLIACCEPDYPRLLAAIADAPPLLSVLGHPRLLSGTIVAIVGARNGSANGIRLAETLARDISRAGLVVASGLARGIDAAGHRGALEGGTVAVMAGGIDVVYPRENEGLYREIAEQGALISEQPLGMTPQARHFPHRNRLVSGLSVAAIIVEATLRSGSLITARLAGEQGREVMAVPGNPLDPRARGTNKLIREGALLIEGADDVLEALAEPSGRIPGPEHGTPSEIDGAQRESVDEATLTKTRDEVTALLGAAPAVVDDIVRKSGIPPQQVAAVLLELELAGRLQRHPGGQVSLAFE